MAAGRAKIMRYLARKPAANASVKPCSPLISSANGLNCCERDFISRRSAFRSTNFIKAGSSMSGAGRRRLGSQAQKQNIKW